MAGEIYVQLQADVFDLLTELGTPLVYTRYATTADRVSGAVGLSVSATQTLATALVPYKDTLLEHLDTRFMEGVSTTKSVQMGIASSVGGTFTPATGDRLAVNGRDWYVLGCTAVNVDGATDVVYVVGLEQL